MSSSQNRYIAETEYIFLKSYIIHTNILIDQEITFRGVY